MVGFDVYDLIFPGGVYREPLMESLWRGSVRRSLKATGPPVDDDSAGVRLAEASSTRRERRGSPRDAPFRDSQQVGFDLVVNVTGNVPARINKGQVPVYLWAGWFDVYGRDPFVWFTNLTVPKKLGVGPWFHNSRDETKRAERVDLLTTEQLRWFDYWLKGVANGIMDEAPIHYAVIMDSSRWEWRDAAEWPVKSAGIVEYYFREGLTGTVESVNDGTLSVDAPSSDGQDAVQVDFTATSGTTTRWTQRDYGDLSNNDAKGLTYTTPPLQEDVLVVGHPVVTLYVSSTASDGDFFVYLEEVDTLNVSHYVTEGVLRASHRAVHVPPCDNFRTPDIPLQ
jgi:putative CocE/NonD family hydrolase